MIKEVYMTIKEAADVLRVSHRTMQRYIADGRISYIRPVHKILIKESDLMKFINRE